MSDVRPVVVRFDTADATTVPTVHLVGDQLRVGKMIAAVLLGVAQIGTRVVKDKTVSGGPTDPVTGIPL